MRKEYFNSTSTSYGGCNKIDPKNFDFEETVVQNEIRIAEYEAKKEKELLNKKKEELKKARISEGKFELNCKDGAKLDPNTKEIKKNFNPFQIRENKPNRIKTNTIKETKEKIIKIIKTKKTIMLTMPKVSKSSEGASIA